jgi:broad specificity phosphatase PhoE
MAHRTFLFLRHGETDFNLNRRFQGTIDVPLNANGVAQAEAAAEKLADQGLTRIVSSPANRVLKTASFVAERTGVPMYIDTDLMEMNVGSFEGQDIASIKKAHGLGERDSFIEILPEDAERWEEFSARVCASVRRWVAKHPDELMLVVAHGLVFRALTMHLAGMQLMTGNAIPHIFELSGEAWNVRPL